MMFTVVENGVKAFPGGFVTVHGGLFTSSCLVNIGGSSVVPYDVSDDSLVFVAPAEIGTFTFTITDGVVSSPSMRLVVVNASEISVNRLPMRGKDEFLQMLIGLMPKGFIWDIKPGTNFYKIFSAVASLLLMIYDLFRSLLVESSPITTTEIELWENELGLPRDGLEQTNPDGRKNEIIRIARKPGGCTLPHYRQLLDMYGKDYEIVEYWKQPSRFPGWVAENYGDQARMFVMFKIYQKQFTKSFTCRSACNSALGNERDLVLEKLLEFDKPAHVQFIYSYAIKVLTDENSNPLTTDDGKLLIV